MSPRPVLAVDHDFPLTLTDSKYWPDAELQPLRSIHPDLIGGHEDWEILRELRVRGGIDGFVTLDRGMLSLPKEMVVLVQSE